MGVRSGLGKRANAYAGDTFGPHIMTGVNATHEAGWLGAGIKVRVFVLVRGGELMVYTDWGAGYW